MIKSMAMSDAKVCQFHGMTPFVSPCSISRMSVLASLWSAGGIFLTIHLRRALGYWLSGSRAKSRSSSYAVWVVST